MEKEKTVWKNYREESRKGYGIQKSELVGLTNEELQLGCLLRIADSTEVMAKNYIELQEEVKRKERTCELLREEVAFLTASVRSHKGAATIYRKKIKKANDINKDIIENIKKLEQEFEAINAKNHGGVVDVSGFHKKLEAFFAQTRQIKP